MLSNERWVLLDVIYMNIGCIARLLWLYVIFQEFTGCGAGLFLKGVVKSAEAVKAAFCGNVDHFQVSGLQQKDRPLKLFFQQVMLKRNAIPLGKMPGKGTLTHAGQIGNIP